MSFFVFFLYASKAAVKIVSKFGDGVMLVDGTWDMMLVRLDERSQEGSEHRRRIVSCLVGVPRDDAITAARCSN